MDEHPAASDQEVLGALLLDPDLERLEALSAEFNIFEAIGAVRQELRHSDFLAFLLNPQQNHGLGQHFLQRFLQTALREAVDPPVSAVDLDLMDLDDAFVLREWRHIDILVDAAETSNLVVLIENKVDSGEHSGQLTRYLDVIRRQYPAADVLPIFLTPEGVESSEDAYVPVSYETMADVLDDLLAAQRSTLGPDVSTLASHYVKMLRRHIVSDSEIASLCRKIYRRHQRALDLLFEHRPDLQAEIADYLVDLVQRTKGLKFYVAAKRYVDFTPAEWAEVPALMSGYLQSRRLLYFSFINEHELSLRLYIGPGPAEMREALFAFMQANRSLFRGGRRSLSAQYTMVMNIPVISAADREGATLDELAPTIERVWQHFLDKDLPVIRDAILTADLPPTDD